MSRAFRPRILTQSRVGQALTVHEKDEMVGTSKAGHILTFVDRVTNCVVVLARHVDEKHIDTFSPIDLANAEM